MPRETSSDLFGDLLHNPNRDSQDAYWLLRADLVQAIARNMEALRAEFREIDAAATNLNRYVASHPRTAFRIFRPEDAEAYHAHGNPLFLR